MLIKKIKYSKRFISFFSAFWNRCKAKLFVSWDSFVLNKQPGEKIFIDCGSNLGQGALFFSRFFSPRDWRYILIEPNPACHGTLRKVARQKLSHRGRPARVIPRAAWISSGERPLYGAGKGAADVGASLNPWHNSSVQPVRKRVGRMVRTFDFGRFLRDTCSQSPSRPKPCVVLKMDIEGAEIPVLQSLIRCGAIGCVKALYVEMHSHYLRTAERKKTKRMEDALMKALARLVPLRDWC